ncbi:MAG: hypothetical protein FWH07_07735 [Oscillospiraceae bacterium]|nr:hypothetical protein [Oscillospiraceae bacterium]
MILEVMNSETTKEKIKTRTKIKISGNIGNAIYAHDAISYLQTLCDFHDKILILERMSKILEENPKHSTFKFSDSINDNEFDMSNDAHVSFFFDIFKHISAPRIIHIGTSEKIDVEKSESVYLEKINFYNPIEIIVSVSLLIIGFIIKIEFDKRKEEREIELHNETLQKLQEERSNLGKSGNIFIDNVNINFKLHNHDEDPLDKFYKELENYRCETAAEFHLLNDEKKLTVSEVGDKFDTKV